jgi:hypothetical protein
MTYGMQIYAADGVTVNFDSSSFGGVPVQKHWQSNGSYLATTYLSISTTNSMSSPVIIDYRDQPGRNIKVIPINSGDTYYRVIQPNQTDSILTSLSAVNYARIAYFTTTPTDFTPTVATHGFTTIATIVMVLIT